jgi:hypothetical protein
MPLARCGTVHAGIVSLIGKEFHLFTIYPKAISSSAR